jgi:threonine dehydrogenase-like Zn-dependent dehydrogenase
MIEIKPITATTNKVKTYRSARISRPGKIEYIQHHIPDVKEDEVLVKMKGCGICASNLPVWEGRDWFSYPTENGTPGHEGWGYVAECGELVKEVKKGDYVAVLSTDAFSEYVHTKEKNILPLPEALRDLPFPGEPFGCSVNILKRADIQKGQMVAVVGLGFIGLSLIPLIKDMGADVIAISRRTSSRHVAKLLGADHVIPFDSHNEVVNKVYELSEKGCERVIECTGKQEPLSLATSLASVYGKLIIAGFHQDGPRQVDMQTWNWNCLDIINAHERDEAVQKSGIKISADLFASGRIPAELLLSHSFSFNQLEEGLNFVSSCPENLVKAYIVFDKN